MKTNKMTVLVTFLALLASAPAMAANWQYTSPQMKLATAAASAPYFQITQDDVAAAVTQEIEASGLVEQVEVKLNPGTPPVLHSANYPVKVSIQALQVDPGTQRWQAQAHVLAKGKTESVKPIAGRYESIIEVPVLTRQLRAGDVIEQADIKFRSMPERTLRKDTVADANSIIGQSPKRVISAERPIRMSEISAPVMVKKGDPVEMSYTTPYMHIKATGTALQDGAKGELIRVKNAKTDKAVSARVEGAGRVEVNTEATM